MKNMEMLGKYKIIGELGRGAMGIVYEAFDTVIERPVAIKTILKSSIQGNDKEEAFGRFRREARAAGRLTHPKIISIFEYDENDEMAYIVMELVRGKELTEYFGEGRRMSLKEGLLIVMQLLDALDYLHTHGVVHRDIKPANIMITEDSKIKIADFGIAKIDSSGHTQVGLVLGTPTYMAPEQFMGHDVDKRADLYAAGVILYLFLTGERPFVGSVIAIMHQAVHRDATPPSEINHDVTKQLDAVVKKAMAKRPEDRYQSAAKFLKALKAASLSLPAIERPLGESAHEVFSHDETMELPGRANSTGSWREADIAAWQSVAHSQDVADFEWYLQEFPNGGFRELAQLRMKSLQQAADEAAKARADAALRAEHEARDVLRATQEKAQAEARAKHEARTKALLARKIALLKSEAEETRIQEEQRREKEAKEQEIRAKKLAASLELRASKLTDSAVERDLVSDAERRMRLEAKRKLEEEVQRRREARMQMKSAREQAESQAEEAAREKKRLEAEALAAREREIIEARAQAQAAERMRQEVEVQAAREQKRSKNLMLFVGIFLVLMFVAIVLGLMPSHR